MDGKSERMLPLVGMVFLLGLALPSQHVTQAAHQSNDAQVLEPGDIYLAGSRSYVHVYKTGLGHEHAIEGRLQSGRINLSGGSGELVFDMRTFSADTDAARRYIGLEGSTDASTRSQVTKNMIGSAVLDAQRYPLAKLKIESVTPVQPEQDGRPRYQLSGTFTLHGVSRQIQVIASADEQELWTHLRGHFSIQQTDYGITPFTKALGAIGVGNRLDIFGDLWIARRRLQAK